MRISDWSSDVCSSDLLVGATTGFLTGGSSYQIGALTERFTALPIIIATWAGRPGDDWEAVTAAAIVVLLGVVLLANTAAILLRNRFERTRNCPRWSQTQTSRSLRTCTSASTSPPRS